MEVSEHAGHPVRPPEIIVRMRAGSAVRGLVENLGVALEPLYPGVADPEMATWYHAVLSERADADAVVERLLDQADVASAYVKPQASAP
ncbi:hypothetical protein EDD29_3378 [Actinocorallia herbida]|uniref:Uncharacterized protein n=1 Tax=Actinocorallia herbida TaxID=58109 RepID=A0A3N1CX01_9ACTN|nr:hypothetical protein [Actinocorallia herbida]ROO85829.1 hypothetical protein EDD29_3378 [Actinocorallia herbida]